MLLERNKMALIKTTENKLNLNDRDFWRVTLSLAIPIALQNMLVASFSLVDTLMVSQLGTVALSSVGMAGQWSWLLNMILFGISSGAAVFISQYWGDKNKDGIHRTLGIAVISSIAVSVLFLAVGLLLPQKVIYIFNKDAEIISSGALYLRYACFSYPAIALNGVLSTVLRSTEHVKMPLVVSGVSTFVNAILNYILIFPAGLGVKGAAIATVVSSWFGVILLILISVIQKNIIIAPPRAIFSITKKRIFEFYKKAAPVILNESMWGLGTVCYNIIFSNLGYEEFAAVTIVKTFEQIAFCFFVGVCNACCVMLGKSIGSGKISRGVKDANRFNVIMPILSVVIGALIIIFRAPLVSLFNIGQQVSGHTLQLAEWIMVIYAAWVTVRNVPYLMVVGIFRAGGDTMTGMRIELLVLWAFAIPITFISAYLLKLPFLAVYAIMYICEDLPKGFLFFRHYASCKWIMPVTESGQKALAEFKSQNNLK